MKYLKFTFFLLLSLIVACDPSVEEDNLELIGHRGATGLLPENTIPSFKKALDYNVDSIELDVVISGDQQVVVSHEPLMRHDICLTQEGDSISADEEMDHLIYEMDYEQIAQYNCGSLQRPGYPDQENRPLSKPLLRDAIQELDAYAADNNMQPVTYNVEIKSKSQWDGELQPHPDTAMELTYEVLSELEVLDRVRIFAFDSRVLKKLQEIDSSVPQVYLIPKSKTDMEKNLSVLGHQPAVYAPNYSIVDSALVQNAHDKGMQVIPWTVNNVEDMKRMVDIGVDGIISDYPNYFSKLDEEQEQ